MCSGHLPFPRKTAQFACKLAYARLYAGSKVFQEMDQVCADAGVTMFAAGLASSVLLIR